MLQFSYYLVALGEILPRTHSVGSVYIDFACKIKKTWKRYIELVLADKLDPDTIEYLRSIELYVNWLHASGHNFECQISNSGRFQDGAGRRVGEQIEQLWSLIKVGLR
jgi:predicted phosphoadenosine phosphosulfate sulfurtransferase